MIVSNQKGNVCLVKRDDGKNFLDLEIIKNGWKKMHDDSVQQMYFMKKKLQEHEFIIYGIGVHNLKKKCMYINMYKT